MGQQRRSICAFHGVHFYIPLKQGQNPGFLRNFRKLNFFFLCLWDTQIIFCKTARKCFDEHREMIETGPAITPAITCYPFSTQGYCITASILYQFIFMPFVSTSPPSFSSPAALTIPSPAFVSTEQCAVINVSSHSQPFLHLFPVVASSDMQWW